MNAQQPKRHKARDKLLPQPLPGELTFEEAVAAVMHAPQLPEQQAKKDAAKARQEAQAPKATGRL